ncbi:hypothetical protein [Mesorhizobium sp. B2-7-1]|uniref:hypothetical protein n=1 Tax=Mesorhizobium sp. B2-7-1 TaxID=2589909 RepID=UPI0011280534|nr:hypothetical protein [Mesorhizobium sp. B2-7-1]TPJ44455.1 hypothetical protein FJ471_32875 [Mesorhizobium sp. B2-7-1]
MSITNELQSLAKRVRELEKRHSEMVTIMKSDSGNRLSNAGRAFASEGVRQGIAKNRVAALLDISPSAMSRY